MDIYKLRVDADSFDRSDPHDPIVQVTKALRTVDCNASESTAIHLSEQGDLYVAENHDIITAAAHFEPVPIDGDPEAWIHILGVRPEFQRSGIGSEMIDYFAARCLDQNIRQLLLHPTPTSLGFYQKLGFTQDDERRPGKPLKKTL